jgi:rhodanese-related sulfurtransferase
MPTQVTAVPAAPALVAEAHFAAEFTFETDCWDVHESLSTGADFVLLDVRSPALYAKGHVPGAINLPPRQNRSGENCSMAKDHPVRHLLRRPALQWRSTRRSAPGQAGTARQDHGGRHHRLVR